MIVLIHDHRSSHYEYVFQGTFSSIINGTYSFIKTYNNSLILVDINDPPQMIHLLHLLLSNSSLALSLTFTEAFDKTFGESELQPQLFSGVMKIIYSIHGDCFRYCQCLNENETFSPLRNLLASTCAHHQLRIHVLCKVFEKNVKRNPSG